MGAAKKGQPIREMSIAVIAVDRKLQSRAATDPAIVHEYFDDLMNGAVFPPVVVFHDGRKYWLSAGFHRLEAYKKAGRASIPADVREGGRREAIEHSVGSNRRMGFRPGKEDHKKAAWMLLSDPEWKTWSDSRLGAMCGVSTGAFARYRVAYCEEEGEALPREVKRFFKDGTPAPVTTYRPFDPDRIPVVRTTGNRFVVSVGGKQTKIKADLEEATKQRDRLMAALKAKRESTRITGTTELQGFLKNCGVVSTVIQGSPYGGLLVGSRLVVACGGAEYDSLLAAITKVLLSGAIAHHRGPSIVVRELSVTTPTISKLIADARRLSVNIMDIESFVASLEADPGGHHG